MAITIKKLVCTCGHEERLRIHMTEIKNLICPICKTKSYHLDEVISSSGKDEVFYSGGC